jgi:hypothetical protein
MKCQKTLQIIPSQTIKEQKSFDDEFMHREKKITHASLGLLLSDRSSLDNVTSQALAHMIKIL